MTASPCSFSILLILKCWHNCEVLREEDALPRPGLGLGIRRGWIRKEYWRNAQQLAEGAAWGS